MPDTFEEMIGKARAVRACKLELLEVEKHDSLESLIEDREAPYWLYWYARWVIKDRWPEVEVVIAKDGCWANSYKLFVIKEDDTRPFPMTTQSETSNV